MATRAGVSHGSPGEIPNNRRTGHSAGESIMTPPTLFLHHNIRLDNGEYTIDPGSHGPITDDFRLISAKRYLEFIFAGTYQGFRIADLGCQEGGYAVEFARMGFNSVGIEARQVSYDACNYVLENVNLPNLSFYKDTVWNLGAYGQFDAIFCQGLLYHLDRPKYFLEYIAPLTRKVLLLQTHFAPDFDDMETNSIYGLSSLYENEGLMGRWQVEHWPSVTKEMIEGRIGASYENRESFWIQRPYLLKCLKEVGFDLVFESFDWSDMLDKDGYYRKHHRGLFIGIKTNPVIGMPAVNPNG